MWRLTPSLDAVLHLSRNRMQMRKILWPPSLAFNLAHVKNGLWTGLRSRSYNVFSSRLTKLSYLTVKIMFAFFAQSIWFNHWRSSSWGWKNRLIFQQHERTLRTVGKFLIINHSRVLLGKPEVMEALDVWQLSEILAKKGSPVINRYDDPAIVRSNKLRLV